MTFSFSLSFGIALLGRLLNCLQKYKWKHRVLGYYGTTLCLQCSLKSREEQGWRNTKIRWNTCLVLRRMHQNLHLRLCCFQTSIVTQGKTLNSPSTLFPDAGQHPVKAASAQQSLYPTTLTLFQENSSFCWRSGQLLITSGSNISSQSFKRPEDGPSQAASVLKRKQSQYQRWCHETRLPIEFQSLPRLTCNYPPLSSLLSLPCPGATRSSPQQLVSWQEIWQWSQQ